MDSDQLTRLAEIEVPERQRGMSDSAYDKICDSYSELASAARYLLDNPRDEEVRSELSGLLNKLGIEVN